MMSNNSDTKFGLKYPEIVIRGEEKDEYYAIQELLEGMERSHGCDDQFSWPSGLKINEEKLFRYGPFQHKEIQKSQGITLKKKQTHINQKNKTQMLKSNYGGSVRNIKQVKHKVTPKTYRLNNQTNKENTISSIFPRMSGKPDRQQNSLNKTTSVCVLKDRSGLNHCQKSKEAEPTIIEEGQGSEIFGSKSSHHQSKFKIRSSRSGSYLSRTFRKDISVSKMQVLQTSENKASTQRPDIKSALIQIISKQEELLNDKESLSEKVLKLREEIERERLRLEEINQNTQKINNYLIRKQRVSKYEINDAKISKKKTENCSFQTKNIENSLNQCSQANLVLSNSIAEQKQLIIMYQTVIEQLKGQLKEQKQFKLDLQRKLAIAKKTKNSLQAKLQTHEHSNREVINNIYQSIGRWS